MDQAPLPGFTPVRRTYQTAPPDPSPNVGKAPWTAARCNRLLRPLTSRLIILHKRKDGVSKTSTQPRGEKESTTRPAGRSSSSHPHQSNDSGPTASSPSDGNHRDPEWVPQPVGKRLKHTYSGRPSKNRQPAMQPTWPQALLPGTVPIDTPVIKRAFTLDFETLSSLPGAREIVDLFGQQTAIDPALRTRKPRPESQHDLAFKPLRKFIDPTQWTLYEGLYAGFDALLKATANSRPPSLRKGSRSLMATTLRGIPQYIRQEELWLQEEDLPTEREFASARSAITTEIYEQLESLGHSGEPGWKPLRQVVRRHGASVLGDAIMAHTFHPEFIKALVQLCTQHSAYEEAEILLQSYMAGVYAIEPPPSPNSRIFDGGFSKGLHLTHRYVTNTKRWGFLYREICYLIETNRLHPAWIATDDFVSLWGHVISAISRANKDSPDAFQLILRALGSSLNPSRNERRTGSRDVHPDTISPRDRNDGEWTEEESQLKFHYPSILPTRAPLRKALNNTFSSLMAALSTMALAEEASTSTSRVAESPCKTASRLLWTLAGEVERCLGSSLCLSSCEDFSDSAFHQAMIITFACVLFSHKDVCSTGTANDPRSSIRASTFSRLIDGINRSCKKQAKARKWEDISGTLANLICSVARSWSRVTQQDGFEKLKTVVNNTMTIAEAAETTSNWGVKSRIFLRQVGLQAAFDFAESVGNHTYLQWAEQLERDLDQKGVTSNAANVLRTPAKHPNGDAPTFRWEDGLCEWVRATPFPNRGGSPTFPLQSERKNEIWDTEDEDAAERPAIVRSTRPRPKGIRCEITPIGDHPFDGFPQSSTSTAFEAIAPLLAGFHTVMGGEQNQNVEEMRASATRGSRVTAQQFTGESMGNLSYIRRPPEDSGGIGITQGMDVAPDNAVSQPETHVVGRRRASVRRRKLTPHTKADVIGTNSEVSCASSDDIPTCSSQRGHAVMRESVQLQRRMKRRRRHDASRCIIPSEGEDELALHSTAERERMIRSLADITNLPSTKRRVSPDDGMGEKVPSNVEAQTGSRFGVGGGSRRGGAAAEDSEDELCA